MSTGTGLFLLGVWIAFAAAIARPNMTERGFHSTKVVTMAVTVLTLICVLIANLYRL